MADHQTKLEPIIRQVLVKVAPQEAFTMFTGSMGSWWPKGKTLGPLPHKAIIIESHAAGRWFERSEDGAEFEWGEVIAWEPPHRVLLAWRLDKTFHFNPEIQTEVEVTFEPAGGGTRVTLRHSKLENFGEGAAEFTGRLSNGWGAFLELYREYAGSHVAH